MNTKISPQQVLELLQAEGTFDKWKKQITDEFVKSEAEKVKNETRDYVFNSKTLASITEIINPKSAAAASIHKDVQDEIMRSGFSDRIHSQVRRIVQIEQDSDTNNNNNDTNGSAFTTHLTDTIKSSIEAAITKLQEPKTPKDIPPTPPLVQPTAKLKSEQEDTTIIKIEPLPKKPPSNAINGKLHSELNPVKKPTQPPKVTIPAKAPTLVSPATSAPATPAPTTPTVIPTPPLPAAPKPPVTKPSKPPPPDTSSSSDSSGSDTSSSSDSDSSSDSSDSDSDTSSSSDSEHSPKPVKKVQSDTKPPNPSEAAPVKPVVIKKKTEKRKRRTKKRDEPSDNNNAQGSPSMHTEKKSRRGRVIKPSGWMIDDDSSAAPIAKRRKKHHHHEVTAEAQREDASDTEVTSIRKKYQRRHRDQEEEQKELQAILEGKRVVCQGKKGSISTSLIVCDCCSQTYNFISFQEHAGCDTGNPWDNIREDTAQQQTLQFYYDQVEAHHKKRSKQFIEESQSSQLDTQSSQVDIQPATPPTPKALSARRRKKRAEAASTTTSTVDELRHRMKGILSDQELEDLIRRVDPNQTGIIDEALCGELLSRMQKGEGAAPTTEVAT
mmetsp:Transcript_29090/g.40939  ORF Transcript_29090/g.40939 Transcript_29090/m.40939 type:complete len:608 (-) Transcript_29090:1007-2830(-)